MRGHGMRAIRQDMKNSDKKRGCDQPLFRAASRRAIRAHAEHLRALLTRVRVMSSLPSGLFRRLLQLLQDGRFTQRGHAAIALHRGEAYVHMPCGGAQSPARLPQK